MRATLPSRVRAVVVLGTASVLALVLAGAASPLKKRNEPPPLKVDETVNDIAYVATSTGTKLEGVGLVVGLDGTGADAPPSPNRAKLVDDMRRAGVENANTWLKNPSVSMVIVRLTVGSGVSPSDRLDVEVEVPPGCGTKSLQGGYLLECRLREVAILGGAIREGSDAAFAQGPVFLGTPSDPDNPKIGVALGGGRIRKATDFQLILKPNRKSFRASAMVEAVVNQRFPQSEGVDQKGSAIAKTDQFLVLKAPRVYHQNEDRFFRVVKLIPMVDNPTLRVQRLELWGKELLDPKTAGMAALRLEALGVTASDALKAGLESPNAQVRFFAAEALAYLNDSAGTKTLAATIREQPEFRAHALAALAALDQEASLITLRSLLSEPDVLVRYGAFNALRTLEPDDAFLGRVRVIEEPRSTDPDGDLSTDSMAVALAKAAKRRKREDPFTLYLVDCEGPPMVHVARTKRCEIVVFGRGQRLLTPLVLGSGPFLVNASEGDDSAEISKIVPSRLGNGDQKVRSPLEIGELIKATANLGANYPDIVAILQGAYKQRNLPGPLIVDAVPAASPEYFEAVLAGKDTTKKDDALQKASAETAEPAPRRGFFQRLRGRFTRNIGIKPDGTRVEVPVNPLTGQPSEEKPTEDKPSK